MKRCALCGKPATQTHHIFNGANRKHSEHYGLTIRLCAECHERVHRDQILDEKLKMSAQRRFEENHSREEFMKIFRKNYLWREDDEETETPGA